MMITAEAFAGRTTGIGSLPHGDIEAALDLSFRMGIPFLPELPSLDPDEGMLGSSFLKSPKLAWEPFLGRLVEKRAKVAKIQIPGPFTFPEYPLADFDSLALKLIEGLSRLGITPILFLDEPGLCRYSETERSSLETLKRLTSELRRTHARIGIHCCGEAPWEVLLDWELDYLSFDCGLSLETILKHKGKAQDFHSRGGSFAFGVVPTDSPGKDAIGAKELFSRFDGVLKAGLPDRSERIAWLSQALFTPACGLAMHSVKSAQVKLETLNEFYEICKTSV